MTRVLVVDDEPQIVRGLRTNLRARGYEVVTAPDGEEALATAARERPDLAIVDLGLPGHRRRRRDRGHHGHGAGCRSSCSRPATRSRTRSVPSTPAPTTT